MAETIKLGVPVTDEERQVTTPKNILAVFAKHYGAGGSRPPKAMPLTEHQTILEEGFLDEEGIAYSELRGEYVQGLVLASLVARVSESRGKAWDA